jgi:hypothetical protein
VVVGVEAQGKGRSDDYEHVCPHVGSHEVFLTTVLSVVDAVLHVRTCKVTRMS